MSANSLILFSGSYSTKRVVKNIKLSKKEHNLYKKLIKMRVKLSKCRNRAQKQSMQLKAAKNLMNSSIFITTVNNLPSAAKILTMLQFREHKKKKQKGRRF